MKKKYIFILSVMVFFGLIVGVYQYFQAFKTEGVSAVTVGVPNQGHPWTQMECNADTLCIDTANKRLGVGTNNPTEKLEVGGNIKASGDICNGTGNCLSAMIGLTNGCGTAATTYSYAATAYSGTYCVMGFPTPTTPAFPAQGGSTTWTCPVTNGSPLSCTASRGSPPALLVNGTHNVAQCTGSGGVVYSNFCMFTSSSCPGGWTQYLSWSATTSVSCSVPYGAGYCCGGTRSCTTSGHGFSNASVESCSVSWATGCSGTSCTPNPQPVCQCGSSQSCSSTITHVGCY
jgi:hypothetical protein